MRIEWQIASPADWEADAVLFFGFEDRDEPLPGLRGWLEATGNATMAASPVWSDFQGKFRQTAVHYPSPPQKILRIVRVGLGKEKDWDLDHWRGAVAEGLRRCRDLRLKRPALALESFYGLPENEEALLEEALVGGLLGLYRYEAPKGRPDESPPQPEALLILHDQEPPPKLREAESRARAAASGVALARDLTVAPANRVTPSSLLETARHLAEKHAFKLDVIDLEKARSLGMGAFEAVARGSSEPGCVLVLEHAPSGLEDEAPLVFVGKGITFDTGGISIKPSSKMELMKHDMAGAAAVLGLFEALGRLDFPRRVVGVAPCTENMPDGKAYKPGDVITTLSGLTVEVISTDAEGRMVLCDALTYAKRFRPALLVDLATLTGACIVALGDQVGGVMGNRDVLVRQVQDLGVYLGEKLWPLPLWDLYFEDLKSDVADFKNVGERKGGAIVGGVFLKQFVPEEIPWVHVDIAGPSWTEKDRPTAPRGATGFGVRLCMEIVRRWPDLHL